MPRSARRFSAAKGARAGRASLVAGVAASLVAACGAAPPPEQDALVRRIDAADQDREALSRRVADLEAKLAAPASSWSCAAKCVTSYSCRSSGDSTMKWRDLAGSGSSAAAAFREVTAACTDTVHITAACLDGKFIGTEATLQNACVKN